MWENLTIIRNKHCGKRKRYFRLQTSEWSLWC